MTTLTLPEDLDIEAIAQWYASNFAAIKAARSFLYLTSKRLTDWVKEGGPVRTPAGLLEILPDGWDYDGEMIRQLMPVLLTAGEATFKGEQSTIERILSLVLEEIPDAQYEVTWTVDKRAFANVVKAGGDAAATILPARKPKGALGVRE
jgi:hypothetical protein